ncbi:MAG: ribonuclease P protein component [Thermodesulfovibrio sp.]|nr:ribonuclease P protein component [Thermodesulfovibrio sp.]
MVTQPKVYHPLRKKGDFKNVFDFGLKFPSKYLVIYAKPNGLSTCRLGLAVGRKVGNAVIRNRIKRRLREALKKRLPAGSLCHDLVFVARTAAADAVFADLDSAVLRFFSKRAYENNSGIDHKTI